MEISCAGFHVFRQICFEVEVDGEALARFSLEGDVELTHHLALAAVAAEEVFGLDLVRLACELVLDG